ncbi:ABC transporter ATP-binding protein [Roseisalinus antarcticus]|uniref:Oligopeptide transport ATP-binding protein OppF n=1 Tax=Roseisalinus antarcticus TaxID=254357 RepID=A0A1Y5TWY7_9RHOB|nr:ABC transporter ATP-binding protein [Roseisalinus antarcticus]SLN75370.1 Oligopeptide transport ATP-binding protein OppF [Roseisalinus antarcticus]
MTALIELRGVRKTFGGFTALDDFSLSLREDTASMTAVAGESGSGKTTLARILLGFIQPSAGQVIYRGRDLTQMTRSEKQLFRREVQPVFQDPFDVFNPFYRVDHVLETPLRRYKLASSRREEAAMIEDALSRVGLRAADTLGRYPHELSGGQRQRVMVARAVLLRPRIIVADEPVSMVDASLRATILDELRTLNRDLGISIIYITHDLTTAFQICDNILVLYKGDVTEAGSVENVIGDPQHPYTQLLVSSIPLPDLSQKWGALDITLAEATDFTSRGCNFAPRCPKVMDVCRTKAPPRAMLDADRFARCFLFGEAPVLPAPDIASVFRPPDAVRASTIETRPSPRREQGS